MLRYSPIYEVSPVKPVHRIVKRDTSPKNVRRIKQRKSRDTRFSKELDKRQSENENNN